MDERYYTMFKSKIKKRVAPEIKKKACVRELRKRKYREKMIAQSQYMPRSHVHTIGGHLAGDHTDFKGVPGVKPKDRFTIQTGGTTVVNRVSVK